MSGIVGIFDLEGRFADPSLLARLTQSIAYRGPDAQRSCALGPAALGHTLLRTTLESAYEMQPASLCHLSITADARIDGRDDLIRDLRSRGCDCSSSAPDSELILLAYRIWGEHCVDRLTGDFSFAIWDARNRCLFCARDRMGLKPFYYFAGARSFVFSNTLECVRRHPDVSAALNESAIADFLLLGLNCDLATTFFADIQRLPPGHTLVVSSSGMRFRRYWSPPIDGCIRYRRAGDYVEHFLELFQAAVADCLRVGKVGILLSGGLDSSSVAAVARKISGAAQPETSLRAYNSGHDYLVADRDREPARLVAEFLGMPLDRLAADDCRLFENWGKDGVRWPEPVSDPFAATLLVRMEAISSHSRVVLSGEGVDNLMSFQVRPYFRNLLNRGELIQGVVLLARLLAKKRFFAGAVGRRIARILRKTQHGPGGPAFPPWIRSEFAERIHLERRWNELNDSFVRSSHPILPDTHASLSLPLWAAMFEQEDPGATRFPVEVRYPFLDVRLMEFLLGIPPFPWFVDKYLLRQAMKGLLPETIRRRPKQAVESDPVIAALRRPEYQWIDRFETDPDLMAYVNRAVLPVVCGEENTHRALVNLRPINLKFWLQSLAQFRYNCEQVEAADG